MTEKEILVMKSSMPRSQTCGSAEGRSVAAAEVGYE